MPNLVLVVGLLAALIVFASPAMVAAQTPSANAAPSLKIVVIDGEDSVNIVQQRTAVSPIVEVRDRNDQPVSGALVTFAIRSGRATFSGARTLTVMTNAAGRAAAAGLTPTGPGALQIGASAVFQGQSAVATIVQTNVLTAAQAAAAAGSGASAAGTGAGGGAAGGGGGLSATTLAVSGAAAVGGGLFAVKALGDCKDCGPGTGDYVGTTSFAFVETDQANGLFNAPGNVNGTCTFTVAVALTLRAGLDENDKGVVTDGHLDANWTETLVGTSCQGTTRGNGPSATYTAPLDGQPTSNLQARIVDNAPPAIGGTRTLTLTFSGAVVSGAITGTFTLGMQAVLPSVGAQQSVPTTGTPVTLFRQ